MCVCAHKTMFYKGAATPGLNKVGGIMIKAPDADARRQCGAYGLPTAPLQMRLVRVTLKGGETEVLATSLHEEHLLRYRLHQAQSTING